MKPLKVTKEQDVCGKQVHVLIEAKAKDISVCVDIFASTTDAALIGKALEQALKDLGN